MKVYLCIDRGQGLTIWHSMPKLRKNFVVYTQKKKAIKEYQQSLNIREDIAKSSTKQKQVMIFSLDIPYKYLEYVSGEKLDEYVTEYDPSKDTTYRVLTKNVKRNQIISAESWHFYIKNTRLKHKRTVTLPHSVV